MALQSKRRETFKEEMERYHHTIDECLQRHKKLNHKDYRFLKSVKTFPYFSDGQIKWIDDCARKCGL